MYRNNIRINQFLNLNNSYIKLHIHYMQKRAKKGLDDISCITLLLLKINELYLSFNFENIEINFNHLFQKY